MLHSLLAAVLIAGRSPDSAHLRTKVLFAESANLTYQLDVVSGMLPHVSPSDFQELWKREFFKSDEDKSFVQQWGDLERRYEKSAALDARQMPLETPYVAVSLFERIRMAGLRSTSIDDFLNQEALLVQPRDEVRYAAILRHFEPRFHDWWNREAAGKGKTFVGGLRHLMEEKQIQDRIEQFRRFYNPDLPDGYDSPFSLIYRPDYLGVFTSGQQLDGIAVVEFLPKEKPERRIDVILHEFCHFLYRSRSEDATLVFQQRFVDLRDPVTRPAFNLLNEGLATALGNGIVGRQMRTPSDWSKFLMRPLSLYNNVAIDHAGKRLLKVMDDWLPHGRTLDDPDFAKTYLAAMKEEFGDDLTAPSLYLGECFLYTNQAIGSAFQGDAMRELHIASLDSTSSERLTKDDVQSFDAQPNLSSLFVVVPGQIDALVLSGVIDAGEAASLHAAKGSVLYSRQRGSVAYTFVIVAENSTEAVAKLRELAAAKRMFTGIAPVIASN